MHNINIKDNNSNWSAWGDLVRGWIFTPGGRPANVGALRTALTDAGVDGFVKGADGRGVTFVDYDDDVGNPLVIPLPTKSMVRLDEDLLDWISTRPQSPYPLPTFYAVAFGGASMVNLSRAELRAMGRRRLGEYVINECM